MTNRTISSIDTGRGAGSRGRGRGTTRGGRGGRGGGGRNGLSCAEIDACTHIEARYYDSEMYKKFTPAEKARHFELTKKRSSSTKRSQAELNELASVISSRLSVVGSSVTVKTDDNDDASNDDAGTTNRNNSALIHQPKKPKT